ncbi:MAG: hypothetical protein MUC36_03765 [Planctomycetes bacterium]|jgi:hypothetical protein|nr:hypothetical protein [Planctomycetota bacterium]
MNTKTNRDLTPRERLQEAMRVARKLEESWPEALRRLAPTTDRFSTVDHESGKQKQRARRSASE